MALILNIDTAVQGASLCLADDDRIVATAVNAAERESAAWLHTTLQDLLVHHNLRPQDLSAVAVSAGPGSYTGLRVGMAAAKGLCYALSVPLITVPTLQMMAAAALPHALSGSLLCPLIDARRTEVFAAIYDQSLNERMPATNLLLSETSFETWLQNFPVLFFGNGSEKARPLIRHEGAKFASVAAAAENMAGLSAQRFARQEFADLAYAEPFYGKEFYSPLSKKIS